MSRLLGKLVGQVLNSFISAVVSLLVVAVGAYLGWTFIVPAQVKETITIEGLGELTTTLRNLQEWAQIEIDKARQ